MEEYLMKQPVKGLVLIILISVLFSITQDNVASTKTEQPRITGIVTDTNGVPLTGVEVTARCRTMGDNFYRLVCPNTWTDENGLFSLPVDFPDLKYSVTFQYRRHSLHQMEIVPSETGELKISLERKASHVITGQVVHHAFLFPDAIVKYFG